MKQFAVIGLGRFGTSVVKTLAGMGYQVLAIDASEEKVEEIKDIATHAVRIDCIDEEALREIGIRNFDVVIVSIGQNLQASILVTVILKELGVKNVIAKAITDLHGKVLAKVGADKVVYPERDMGIRLAHHLVSENVVDIIELSPDYSILEVIAPPRLIGKSLAQSALRARMGVNVMAIKRGNDILIAPRAEEIILENDILVVVGTNKRLLSLERGQR